MKGKKKAADRSSYWQRYYAENLDREQARKRQWYLDNRAWWEKILARP